MSGTYSRRRFAVVTARVAGACVAAGVALTPVTLVGAGTGTFTWTDLRGQHHALSDPAEASCRALAGGAIAATNHTNDFVIAYRGMHCEQELFSIPPGGQEPPHAQPPFDAVVFHH